MEYYSDKINGTQPRNVDVIPNNVWGGVVSIINGLISSGAFGKHFPEDCPDGQGVYTTSETNFKQALSAEIPDIEYPFVVCDSDNKTPYTPNYLTVLDLIQFCHRYVTKPTKGGYHGFFQPSSFDFRTRRRER
tara:strand:+ start:151 stop:549 length:399 start_codon:yes stop_codon:yes gene_type:complete